MELYINHIHHVTIMNKWQKIAGIVSLTVIPLVGIFWQVVTYADIRAWKVTFAAHDCKDVLYAVMGGYAFLFWISYALHFASLFVFGGKEASDETDR